MGPIIAQLSRMGLTNIGFELITDVLTYNRNVPREIDHEAFALAWFNDHPTFRMRELARHFESDGRPASSANYVVGKLVKAGTLKALGGGNYQRADVMAIQAPTASATDTPKRRAAAEPKQFATRGEDEILKFARKHGGKFNTTQLIELFEGQGRARNSVYASCNTLMNEKKIKRVGASGSGEYVLLAKGKAKPKAVPKKKAAPAPAPAAHLNGNSNAEIVING